MDQQAYVSQTPEEISDPQDHFTYAKLTTKNSIFDNFESKNMFKFSKIKKHIKEVCTENNRHSVEKE